MIKTKFQECFEEGVLSKIFFQKSEITKSFVNWLIPYINGGKALLDLEFKNTNFQNLNDVIEDYKWGKGEKIEDFIKTYNRFEKYREVLKIGNDDTLKSICLDILKWGGVEAHNKEKINRRKNLRAFLTLINSLVESDEIFIDDLNPNHINSGYTKIYTALNSNFIMYDGRVGGALGFIVRKHLEEHGLMHIPPELNFGWGPGQGRANRDPSNASYKFTNISQNRTLHFTSNIKANWLLETIANDISVKIQGANNLPERVFALQTALFVLGKELPKHIYHEV